MNLEFIFALIASFTVLFIGVVTVFHDKKSVTNKLFALVGLSTISWGFANYFSLHPVLFPTLLWIRLVLFFAVPHIIFFYFFVRNFPHRDLRIPKIELFLVCSAAVAVMILALGPSVFESIKFIDSTPVPTPGFLMPIFSIFVLYFLIASVVQIIIKYIKADSKSKISWRSMLLGFIISYLLIIFTNFVLVSLLGDTRFIAYGPLFMLPVVVGTAYSILRYELLNVKAIATEIIAFILLSITLIQVVISPSTEQFIFNTILFCVFLLVSIFLVKSVIREVEQKEELQMLVKQRESLEHLISHKVKGSFTRSKYIFAEMLAGSFGELTKEMKNMAEVGLESNNSGIKTVDLILNSVNLQNNLIKYDMKRFDFKGLVEEVVREKQAPALAKGLTLSSSLGEGEFPVLGDVFWLKEVVNNLVENAVRYTKSGSIEVNLKKDGKKVLLSVKDTGVGITEEDKKNLFTEGGRGKDSVKINTDSTGYGLYSVKLILEAHKGAVWAESAGAGTGSTFYVRLDLVA